ncbi:MAG: sigma-70 family RNA polymerase sigma factor [Stenotrophobium sp.]
MAEDTNARRFEAVAAPHMDAAYNLARWLTRDPHDAEDVVQEAYLRAFRFFAGFRGGDGRAWLLTIVRNTFYTWWQQNRRGGADVSFDETNAEHTEEEAPDTNPEILLLRLADQQLVGRALEQLPVDYREILVLRELEDFSYKEIADIAGIPIGTVMSRLSRGRRLLKACIERVGEEH